MFEPVEGRVSFARLESIILNTGGVFDPEVSGNFAPLSLERPVKAAQTPPSTDRIFIVDVPGQPGTVFYALSNEQLAWRLPLHATNADDNTNAVRFAFFNGDSNGRVVGMLPFGTSATDAWLAMSTGTGNDELLRLTFDK